MKKIGIAILFVMMGWLCCVSLSYAVDDGSWGSDLTSIDFDLSKNVEVYWDQQDNQHYALGSKHTAGNRVYATTDATSKVFYQENDDWKGDAGSSLTGVTMPNPGDTEDSFGSDWNS